MSTLIDPGKLKVVELRAELSTRGLDTKGNKPVLVKRLRDALETESGTDLPDTSIADTTTEDLNSSVVSDPASPPQSAQADKDRSPESSSSSESLLEVNSKAEEETELAEQVPEKESSDEQEETEEKMDVQDSTEIKDDIKSVPEEIAVKPNQSNAKETAAEDVEMKEQIQEQLETDPKEDVKEEDSVKQDTEAEDPEKSEDVEMAEEVKEETEDSNNSRENTEPEKESTEPRNRKSRWGAVSEPESVDSGGPTASESTPTPSHQSGADESRGEKRRHSSQSPDRVSRKRSRSPIREDEPPLDGDDVQLSWTDSDLNLEINKECFITAEPLHLEGFGYMWAGVRATHGVSTTGKVWYEVKLLENCEWVDTTLSKDSKDKDKDRNKETSADDKERDKDKETSKEETKDDVTEKVKDEEEKVKDEEEKVKDEEEKVKDEEEKAKDEEEKDDEIDEVKDDAKQTDDTETKVEDKQKKDEVEDEEMKDESETDNKIDDEKEDDGNKDKEEEEEESVPEPTHMFRVGWSLPSTGLQLGEEPHSYAYDAEGFTVSDTKFTEYGKKYVAGDVVGAFLDLQADNVTITYTVNGELQATAFSVPRADLPEDVALFAHVLTRNVKFVVNFGQNDEPWYKPPSELDDYTFVKDVEEKTQGRVRAEKRDECEVVMMVGLPSSGKTHWASNHVAEHPEKNYTVLGISTVLDKMKHNGKSRKDEFCGSRRTLLMDKCSRCLSKLIEMASMRRRNYILDQTNLFSSAQRRKMRPFDGFRRHAVVIVVPDDEQTQRERTRQQADGKDVPDSAVLEMKASMCLPMVCDWLDEVTYAELDESKAKETVQKYNKLGREAGYGPNYTAKHSNSQRNKTTSSSNSNNNNNNNNNNGDRRGQWTNRNTGRRDSRDNRNNRWAGSGESRGNNRQNNWGGSNRGSGNWGGRNDNRNHHHSGGGGGGSGGGGGGGYYRSNSNNRMISGGSSGGGTGGAGAGGGGYNRNQGSGGGGGGGSGYNRNRNQPPHRNPMSNKGGSWGSQGSGGGGGGGGSWNNQGSWSNQGGWGSHQSSSQSGGTGAGWQQGSWNQYSGGQASQGGGSQQWKSSYGAQQQQQQQYQQQQQQQGYAQGYAAGQYGSQQYPNWNYYGQYAQGWNAQGQTPGGNTSASDSASTAQYNQYTQQQQAAWAQYAQGGYSGGYGQTAAQQTGNTVTGTSSTQSTTK